MNDFKHTKGPWQQGHGEGRHNAQCVYSESQTICQVYGIWQNHSLEDLDYLDDKSKEHISEGMANARLISAAPELLEALKPFAHYLTVMEAMGGRTPRSGPVWGCHSKAGDAEITVEDMQIARAAIAKATGKEPA